MICNLKDKKEIVDKFHKIAKNSISIVVADYCGVPVNKITELRKLSRESGIQIKVIRNTLIRRIIKKTNFECLKDKFIGPNLIAFSNIHPGTAARLFKNFSKENKNFEIKLASFKSEIIKAHEIDKLANIPTFEEALLNIIFTMKEACLNKLLRTIFSYYKKKEDKL